MIKKVTFFLSDGACECTNEADMLVSNLALSPRVPQPMLTPISIPNNTLITFGPLGPVWGMGVREALPGRGSRHTQCIFLRSACWSKCTRCCPCSSLHLWIPLGSAGKTSKRKKTHHRFCGDSKIIFHILIGVSSPTLRHGRTFLILTSHSFHVLILRSNTHRHLAVSLISVELAFISLLRSPARQSYCSSTER